MCEIFLSVFLYVLKNDMWRRRRPSAAPGGRDGASAKDPVCHPDAQLGAPGTAGPPGTKGRRAASVTSWHFGSFFTEAGRRGRQMLCVSLKGKGRGFHTQGHAAPAVIGSRELQLEEVQVSRTTPTAFMKRHQTSPVRPRPPCPLGPGLLQVLEPGCRRSGPTPSGAPPHQTGTITGKFSIGHYSLTPVTTS